jgi:hypothetical protein
MIGIPLGEQFGGLTIPFPTKKAQDLKEKMSLSGAKDMLQNELAARQSWRGLIHREGQRIKRAKAGRCQIAG